MVMGRAVGGIGRVWSVRRCSDGCRLVRELRRRWWVLMSEGATVDSGVEAESEAVMRGYVGQGVIVGGGER